MTFKEKKELKIGYKRKEEVDGILFVEERSVHSYKEDDPHGGSKFALYPAIHNGEKCWLLEERCWFTRGRGFIKESILPYFEDERK